MPHWREIEGNYDIVSKDVESTFDKIRLFLKKRLDIVENNIDKSMYKNHATNLWKYVTISFEF